MSPTRRRRAALTVLACLFVATLLEGMAAVAISLAGSRLDEPIRRTRTIYADQSRAIRSTFFSDTARGIIFDRELGWTNRPDWRSATTAHNSAGLRGDREYAQRVPQGTLRVAAFGDSFVYGHEVSSPDAWPAIIEAADSTVEVLNYGVGGYGVDQAFLRFVRESGAMAPHVVLMCFATDDLRRVVNVYRRFIGVQEVPLFKPRFEMSDRQTLTLRASPAQSLADYDSLLADPRRIRSIGRADQWYESLVYENPLYDWSATVRLVTTAWNRVANRYFRPDRIYNGAAFNTESPAFQLQLAIFADFRDSVAASGAQPVIVLLPDRESIAALARGGSTVYAPLATRLASMGVPIIDAADAFSKRIASGETGAWFMPGGHYSPAGNAVVGEWVAVNVRRLTARR